MTPLFVEVYISFLGTSLPFLQVHILWIQLCYFTLFLNLSPLFVCLVSILPFSLLFLVSEPFSGVCDLEPGTCDRLVLFQYGVHGMAEYGIKYLSTPHNAHG